VKELTGHETPPERNRFPISQEFLSGISDSGE
jgi:hypothetical protein